jgi:hypothetical protein
MIVSSGVSGSSGSGMALSLLEQLASNRDKNKILANLFVFMFSPISYDEIAMSHREHGYHQICLLNII